jgi:tetratricopeptide (TPR) repeat protein
MLAETLWLFRGYWSEGRERVAQVLALSATSDCSVARIQALRGAGRLAVGQSDREAALPPLEESVALARALGDRHELARSLAVYGGALFWFHRREEARAVLEESAVLFRATQEQRLAGEGYYWLGCERALANDFDTAVSLADEAVRICSERDDLHGFGQAMDLQALIALRQGQLDQGAVFYRGSLEARQRVGDVWGIMVTFANLSSLAEQQGDHDQSEACAVESLTLSRAVGDRPAIFVLLLRLGRLALLRTDYHEARSRFREGLLMAVQLGNQTMIARGCWGWRASRPRRSLASRRPGGSPDCSAPSRYCWSHWELLAISPNGPNCSEEERLLSLFWVRKQRLQPGRKGGR